MLLKQSIQWNQLDWIVKNWLETSREVGVGVRKGTDRAGVVGGEGGS